MASTQAPKSDQRSLKRKHCSREDFINAALEICDHKGYPAITARRISKLSHHSTMALYRHFESMEHLLAVVWNECYARMSADIWIGWDQVRGRGLDGRNCADRLDRGFRIFVSYAKRFPNRFWFMFSTRPLPEQFGLPNEALKGFGGMAKLIESGIAAGEFRRDLDPLMTTLKLSKCLVGHSCLVAPTSIGELQGIDPEVFLSATIADALANILAQP